MLSTSAAPVKAACYCRVSTSKESQLDSLDKQHEFFRMFFQNHPEYELYELYTDEGISAKSMKNRAAFLRMIRDAEEKKFDIIFVKDVSRFARNAKDFFNTLDRVTRAGGRINFITLDMTSEPANEFMLGLLALVAQEESANLSKKTKFGKDITAAKGRVPNFVFGYERMDNYTLSLNQNEAGWVRRIFGLYVNEELGTAKIAEFLNQQGVMSKKKNVGAWTQHVVCQMLKNELYIGNVINRKSEVVDFREGTRRKRSEEEWNVVHRPDFRIISDEMFERAQRLMASRNDAFRTQHKRASNKFPLSNLLVCADDGYSFRRCVRQYARGGKHYVFWVCSHRNAKGASCCMNTVRVDEADLLSVLYAFLQEAANSREQLAKEAAERVREDWNRREKAQVDWTALNREKQQLESKRERYMELYADGLAAKESVTKKLQPVNGRLLEIAEMMNLHANRGHIAVDAEAAVRAFVDRLDAFGRGAKDIEALTNPFLKSVFERIVVHGDGNLQAFLKLHVEAGVTFEMPLAVVSGSEAMLQMERLRPFIDVREEFLNAER